MVTQSDMYVLEYAAKRAMESGKRTMEVRTETAVEIFGGTDKLSVEDRTVYERLTAEAPEAADSHTSVVVCDELLKAMETFSNVVPEPTPTI